MNPLKQALFLALYCASISCIYAQQVTITTGAAWTDATIIRSLKPAESYMATTNYNSYLRLSAAASTHSSAQIIDRNLLKFDLFTVPTGATISSAVLYFYRDPAMTSGELSNQPK